jgi:hypothetical protein
MYKEHFGKSNIEFRKLLPQQIYGFASSTYRFSNYTCALSPGPLSRMQLQYQMGNSFARFTVYDIASCIQSDPKFFVHVDFIVA